MYFATNKPLTPEDKQWPVKWLIRLFFQLDPKMIKLRNITKEWDPDKEKVEMLEKGKSRRWIDFTAVKDEDRPNIQNFINGSHEIRRQLLNKNIPDQVNLILINDKFAEGISFLDVDTLTIVGFEEDSATIEQVKARGRRFCGHRTSSSPKFEVSTLGFNSQMKSVKNYFHKQYPEDSQEIIGTEMKNLLTEFSMDKLLWDRTFSQMRTDAEKQTQTVAAMEM